MPLNTISSISISARHCWSHQVSPARLSLPPSMVLGQILALSTEAAWRPKLWILKLASNPISGDRP